MESNGGSSYNVNIGTNHNNDVLNKVFLLSGTTFYFVAICTFAYLFFSESLLQFIATVEFAGAILGFLSTSAFLTLFISLKRYEFLMYALAFFIYGSQNIIHSSLILLFSESASEIILPCIFNVGSLLTVLVFLSMPLLNSILLKSKKRDFIKKLIPVIILTVSIFILIEFLLKPTPVITFEIFGIRPINIFNAFLFSIVAIRLFFYKNKEDSMRSWVLISILVFFISHVVSAFSNSVGDIHFGISHFYYAFACVFPMVGYKQFQVSIHQKQIETQAKLRESEERLSLAIFGGDLGTWDWNVKTGDIKVNERWVEMIGYKKNQFATNFNNWEKLVHPDDLNNACKILEKHLTGDTDYYETTYRMKRRDGRWVWILDKGKLIERNLEGEPIRATGTHLDVTQQKIAEEALKKERDLFATGPVVLFIWRNEPSRPVDFVSKNVEEVLGYTNAEFMSSSIKYKSIVHPEDVGKIEEEAFGHYEDKNTVKYEHQPYRILKKDGSIIWVSDYTSIIRDNDGNISHTMGYILDITQKREAERLEIEAQKLRTANQMAATIAHEFNNPLAVIKTNIEVLEMEEEITEDIFKNRSEKILKMVDRMKDLVQKLLILNELEEVPYVSGKNIINVNPKRKEVEKLEDTL